MENELRTSGGEVDALRSEIRRAAVTVACLRVWLIVGIWGVGVFLLPFLHVCADRAIPALIVLAVSVGLSVSSLARHRYRHAFRPRIGRPQQRDREAVLLPLKDNLLIYGNSLTHGPVRDLESGWAVVPASDEGRGDEVSPN
jgi:hypothetical protein